MASTPRFRQPAEWAPHAAVWTAWPANAREWGEPLAQAQEEFAAFCRAIADVDPETGVARGEALKILVLDAEGEAAARAAIGDTPVDYVHAPYGDIWLRDTAPIFLRTPAGTLEAAVFSFNGWGGKYLMPGDETIPSTILGATGVQSVFYDLVFEGGSIDVDGLGNAITTRECLLNPNRNPGLDADRIEAEICDALGIEKLIWIDRGLLNDHTDGHLDNVARFVGPGKVACMAPTGEDDPNETLYQVVRQTLENATTATGEPLEVVTIPSPGRVLNAEGKPAPASHLNFYVSNTRVIVPYYETVAIERLVEAFQPHFPDREIVVLPGHALLTGGGSFHCITQQQPV